MRNRTGSHAVLVLCAICSTFSSFGQDTPLTRERLCDVPATLVKGSAVISEDGKSYAFVTETHGGQRVVHSSGESGVFRACSRAVFAPVTNKVFFWALQSEKVVIVADGAVIPTVLTGEGEFVFSADGSRWAAYGGTGTLTGGQAEAGVVIVFVDGREIGRYADTSVPCFSQDAKHVAWLTLTDDERMQLVVDGETAATYPKPEVECSFIMRAWMRGPNMHVLASTRYLSNGDLVSVVRDRNGWTVLRDETPLASYAENVWGGSPFTIISFGESFEKSASLHGRSISTASDAPKVAWWEKPAGEEMRWRVVADGNAVDNVTCTEFWSFSPPVWSRNGKRLAYPADQSLKAADARTVFLVVDGAKRGPYAHVWGIQFCDTGEHIAFAASDGSKNAAWRYYCDEKAYPLKYDTVYAPCLSPSGKNIAWKAERDGKTKVAVNGEELEVRGDVLWGPRVDDDGLCEWVELQVGALVRATAQQGQ